MRRGEAVFTPSKSIVFREGKTVGRIPLGAGETSRRRSCKTEGICWVFSRR